MKSTNPKTYPLPKVVKLDLNSMEDKTPLLASLSSAGTATRAQLERASFVAPGTTVGMWAEKVLHRESIGELDRLLAGGQQLPLGVLDEAEDVDVVKALVLDGRSFTAAGWSEEIPEGEQIELDDDTVAFVASAFKDGANGVVLRQWFPLADLGLTAAGAPSKTVPAGAKTVAVVDDIDRNAVLELLAVAPGPKVYRRHDGAWTEDPSWLSQLRAPTPPPLVKVDQAILASVEAQVDEATAGQPFSDEPVTASAYSGLISSALGAEHWRRADEVAVRMALLAAPTPSGAKGAETLRQYWLHGKGAAKIRWGVPGDWKRCVRQLSKYLGVRAKGYCQLMHGRATGSWAGPKAHSKAPSPAVKAQAIAKQHAR